MIVTLSTVWVNLDADRSDRLQLAQMQQWNPAPAQNVTVDPYAGARFRVLVTPGTQQTMTPTAKALTPTDRAWLEAHQGLLCWFRDDRGRKFAGVFTGLQINEHAYDGNSDVQFTVTEATQPEAV